MNVSMLGLMQTIKMLVENYNRYSRDFMLTGRDFELGAKSATIESISYLAEDLNLIVEFGTEYTENGMGYTTIRVTRNEAQQ